MNLKLSLFISKLLVLSTLVVGQVAAPNYALEATAPRVIELSGVLKPEPYRRIDQTFDAKILVFEKGQRIPTISRTQQIQVDNNFFRANLDISQDLLAFFEAGYTMHTQIRFADDLVVELPFASIPGVIKSAYALRSNRMVDESVFNVDYDNKRIGLGTAQPMATFDIVGTVNASQHFIGDGSGLTNLKYKGEDNYNFLSSENGQYRVVTVNINGKVLIGARDDYDDIQADITTFGSLLMEPNDDRVSAMVSGAGSRFMWFSERNVLRIGRTESNYWDDSFSGDNSIVFGYSGIGKGASSLVTGGFYNEVFGDASIIIGGSDNQIYGQDSVIVGGEKNRITSSNSIILGGMQNRASMDAMVLGGFENKSYGQGAIVSGFQNIVTGDDAIVLGGSNHELNANGAIAFGQKTRAHNGHDNVVLFGLSDLFTDSVVSNSIQIQVDQGMAINREPVKDHTLAVNGDVQANQYIGDARHIKNIKNPESVWEILIPTMPNHLILQGNLGIGRDHLVESLNVSGSIQLTGEGIADEGTIQYLNDQFEVFKNNEWQTLQMVDTNTTYNATQALTLDPTTLTFHLTTNNASIGQVLKWDGTKWEPSFLDQFIEEAVPSRINDLALTKRLYYPSGDIVINAPKGLDPGSFLDRSLTVFVDDDAQTALYLSDYDDNQENSISLSVDPPGLHFQGAYEGGVFKSNKNNGASIEATESGLVMSVDTATGINTPVLTMSSRNISILDNPSQRSAPFYIGGELGSKHLVLSGKSSHLGLYLRDPYFRDCSIYDYTGSVCYGDQAKERAVLLEQSSGGELVIQSVDSGGDIIFQQQSQTIGRVRRDRAGQTMFAVNPDWVRSNIDVRGGSVHVSDGYGVGFYHLGQHRSSIVFDSKKDVPIHIFASNSVDTPHLAISSTGNVALNAEPNPAYDLLLNDPNGERKVMLNFDSVDKNISGLALLVDSNKNDDLSDPGDQYQLVLATNNMLKLNAEDQDLISITQSNQVGVFDDDPQVAFSVKTDTTLLNQGGLYFKETGGSSYPALISSGNTIQLDASDVVDFINNDDNVILSVSNDGVGLKSRQSKTSIQSQDIGLDIDGRMIVGGDIYNSDDDRVYPLDIQNELGAKQLRRVKNIQVNDLSGLSLTGSNTNADPLVIRAKPYYNRIKLPDGSLFVATKNMPLRLVGRGITVSANNIEERSVAGGLTSDQIEVINDLISGGEISSDLTVRGDFIVTEKIKGDASGLRNIPFRWQMVTRNNTAIADPADADSKYHDEGEIYYHTGNIGINTDRPSTLFEVVGTASVNELIVSEGLKVSSMVSTEDIKILSAAPLGLNSLTRSLTIGRHAPSLTDSNFESLLQITNRSQLLVGTQSSDYLVDVGKQSSNLKTSVLLNGSQGSYLDLKRDQSSASLRLFYDDNGQRSSKTYPNSNLRIAASNDILFAVNKNKEVLRFTDQGQLGILTSQIKNTMDINGNLSIGFSQPVPENGVAVNRNVAVGFDTLTMPRYDLEVSGSVVVGEPLLEEVSEGLFINSDGTAKLFVGLGSSNENVQVASTGDLTIRNGRVLLREGKDDGLLIQRDNTNERKDLIEQKEDGYGLTLNSNNGIRWKVFDAGSWKNQLVMNTDSWLGIGGDPSTPLHIMDNDSSTKVKFFSASNSMIHLKQASSQALVGANTSGFKFKVGSSLFNNAEITIKDNDDGPAIGINVNPIDKYMVNVNGRLDATQYKISNQYDASGFHDFQSVPSGVIMLWVGDESNNKAIPTGWEEFPLKSKFVKGWGDSSVGTTGGNVTATFSSVNHSHNQSVNAHAHEIDAGGHEHTLTFSETSLNFTTTSSGGYTSQSKAVNSQSYSDYTVLGSQGSHSHTYNNKHTHDSVKHTVGTHTHGGKKAENHVHNTENSGDGGGTHNHTLTNRPEAHIVYFLKKKDEL